MYELAVPQADISIKIQAISRIFNAGTIYEQQFAVHPWENALAAGLNNSSFYPPQGT